jgi:uncharacterized protein (DUF736 family)
MNRKKQEHKDAAYGALWKNRFAGNNKAPYLTGEVTLSDAFIEELISRYDAEGEIRLSVGGWKRIAENSNEPYIVVKLAFPFKAQSQAEPDDDWEFL